MSLGTLFTTPPKELQEISPISSESSSSIVIDFSEYVENAHNSRAEQKAARSDHHNVTKKRLPSSWEDFRQHVLSLSRIAFGYIASNVTSTLTQHDPRSVITSLGRAFRKDSLSSPRPATTRKTSWVTIFLMIVSVCNDSTVTVLVDHAYPTPGANNE